MKRFLLLSFLILPALLLAGDPYKPTEAEIRANYQRADSLPQRFNSSVFNATLTANWYSNGEKFFYLSEVRGVRKFISVEAKTGTKSPAFDHKKLAESLSKSLGRQFSADSLPFRTFRFESDEKEISFQANGKAFRCKLNTYQLEESDAPRNNPNPRQAPWRQNLNVADTREKVSSNGEYTLQIRDFNVYLKTKSGEETKLTTDGTEDAYYARLQWTPDSRRMIATRVTKGDRNLVHLIESSPAVWGPAVLKSRVYDRPGDKVDTFDLSIIDPAAKTVKKIDAPAVDYGEMPQLRFVKGGSAFHFDKMDRGYGRWRLFETDSTTGETQTLIDEDPETFVDSTSQYMSYVDGTNEIIYWSERDGWGHLYLLAPDGKFKNQITKGQWVVRSVTKVDPKARTITFMASGRESGIDPYFLHCYRVNFDGTGLTRLTDGDGSHTVQFSPDGSTLVDTYSSAVNAPVHTLRRFKDGSLIANLEKADDSDLGKNGISLPKVFVAKGRDGKTDIWGVYYLPANFDPKKSYPIIEDIYAGPHDSFAPKTYGAYKSFHPMTELGFVVVKMDGMGTRNRGKAFHDVCWKNLADNGFPDRILWIRALAAKNSFMDINRVGIFGTSAGGQSSTAALLFQPDFYKVAVSSCGCHDNRLDKIWWNEQWMGVVGPHYEAQSNITNAGKLKGHLMLMVGELDTNVPPESTYRLADALIKARKEFELVVLPGLDHTSGGQYGERKRRDYFVRHLLGVDPPSWNSSNRF